MHICIHIYTHINIIYTHRYRVKLLTYPLLYSFSDSQSPLSMPVLSYLINEDAFNSSTGKHNSE